MANEEQVLTHPVQLSKYTVQENACAPQVVTLRAYEVYIHLHGPQVALITGGCRGGFGVSELIALLYAHSFPRDEWRTRVDEAFRGLRLTRG